MQTKDNKFADFSIVKIDKNNPKWQNAVFRQVEIYKKDYDLRNPFERDMHRILHSNGYRRLKNKTQVFFAPHNDHICTRIEHVTHVSAVAEIIAKFLNLNLDLVRSIAMGHDIGHAPFGHQGEYILKDIAQENHLNEFWHERNSLHFIDKIETLTDYNGMHRNLDLTYAVRDGIVCHCGEIDERFIKPRDEFIDLYTIPKGGKVAAYTYEGCVVKIADKIGYIGRDIEDAMLYGLITEDDVKSLENEIKNTFPDLNLTWVNTTVLMHQFIIDLCKNSSIEQGFCFSEECFKLMKAVKRFNYERIYFNKRLQPFKDYARLVLTTIYNKLNEYFGTDIKNSIEKEKNFFHKTLDTFEKWIIKYSNYNIDLRKKYRYENTVVYDISNKSDYENAIIDFISGMSDNFAIDVFNEIISF